MSEDYNVKEDRKAGRYRTIERIIMLIFIYKSIFSYRFSPNSKSIARYERITKEEHFAEYYLLGTLISTLIAIIVHLYSNINKNIIQTPFIPLICV